MDPRRFDSLTRALAEPKTRRGLLGVLAALGAGLLGARAADAKQVTQAQCGNVICYNRATQTVDRPCNTGCVCCVYGNGNSRCTPAGQCSGTVTAPTTTTTTAAPTTTTTSAPATTTTTTTAAPATTTTAPPQAGQGTCLAGQNSCLEQITCNNDPGCVCHQTTSGATVCVSVSSLVAAPCQTDAQCVPDRGPGAVCIVCPNLGYGCAQPCPV